VAGFEPKPIIWPELTGDQFMATTAGDLHADIRSSAARSRSKSQLARNREAEIEKQIAAMKPRDPQKKVLKEELKKLKGIESSLRNYPRGRLHGQHPGRPDSGFEKILKGYEPVGDTDMEFRRGGARRKPDEVITDPRYAENVVDQADRQPLE